MCRRYVLSFLIFVISIEIGALGDLYAVRTALPENELENLTKVVDRIPTQEPSGLRDLQPLDIEYDGSSVNGNSYTEYYTLTNAGIEPIYFETDEHSLQLPVYLSNAFPWSKDVVGEVSKRELLPGDSATLKIPLSPDIKYFNFSIKYQLGNRYRTRSQMTSGGLIE